MKTALVLLISLFLISCEKSEDANNQDTKLSVRDLGIELNVNYRVQKLDQAQFVDLPGPVLVNFVSETQVTEKAGTHEPISNDYAIKGRGTINNTALKIVFFALAPRCDMAPCPFVTTASLNSELYKEGNDLLLKRFTDVGGDTYRLIKN